MMESQLAKLASKYGGNLEDTWGVYVPRFIGVSVCICAEGHTLRYTGEVCIHRSTAYSFGRIHGM